MQGGIWNDEHSALSHSLQQKYMNLNNAPKSPMAYYAGCARDKAHFHLRGRLQYVIHEMPQVTLRGTVSSQ